MALTAYINATQALLENPVPSTPLYTTTNLTTYINYARNQLAADSECLHYTTTFSAVSGTQAYSFTSISSGVTGVGSLISIQAIAAYSSGVLTFVAPRPWPWFYRFFIQTGTTVPTGVPTQWAQLGEGVNAKFWLYPTPATSSSSYQVDGVYLPIALADDTTVEAIPALFTDAIPFYAAYYAYMSSQRNEDAAIMYNRYQEYVRRGRQLSTPTVLANNYPGGLGAQIAASRMPLSMQVKSK